MGEAGTAGVMPAQDPMRRLGRRMVILGALAQNVAIGLMFGSFGTLVVEIERRLHVDRGLSTLGVALVILAMGAISPLIGRLQLRFRLRTMLIAGALLCAAGYALAGVAQSITVLLCAYGLLVGPGIALLGLAVPSALVANWFETGRGRAIGVVNMPIMVGMFPPISAALLASYGLSGVYFILAGITLLLVPALLLVIDRPSDVGGRPIGRGADVDGSSEMPISQSVLLHSPDYWRLGLAAAILGGGGALIATHITPMAIGEGVAPPLAALLISVLGVAGVVGSPLYGMLADRIGGGRALAVNAIFQAVMWAGLLLPIGFPLLVVVAALIGVNSGGMVAALGTALGQRFGAASLGGALGLWSLINLPFSVGLSPLAGFLFGRFGSYAAPFALQISLFLVAGLLAIRAGHARP